MYIYVALVNGKSGRELGIIIHKVLRSVSLELQSKGVSLLVYVYSLRETMCRDQDEEGMSDSVYAINA